ncbi:hypothetical protein [Nocardia cerradoensis]|uniref:Uncharacterized protein n=1 Tax=Nocardia cerradoensis TaxID=85688 RepID=A0A231H2A6_9NOCA|nr:hypothetical protein [Nocardia cerradoensis]NKY43398.1 hypothetical protein [Nocardia cerradoensis]OXR42972.1 hypothetical protein B7C42_04858 [Nocardia cerradoensis]
MSDRETNTSAAQADPVPERSRELTARADTAGYVLLRSVRPQPEWTLLDRESGEEIFRAAELGAIEQWLDS